MKKILIISLLQLLPLSVHTMVHEPDSFPIQDALKALPKNTTSGALSIGNKQYDFLLDDKNSVIGIILSPSSYNYTFKSIHKIYGDESLYKFYILILKQITVTQKPALPTSPDKNTRTIQPAPITTINYHVGLYFQKPTWTGNEKPNNSQLFPKINTISMYARGTNEMMLINLNLNFKNLESLFSTVFQPLTALSVAVNIN